jgi:DNA-binding LacI/PurR family transcriptional regulator
LGISFSTVSKALNNSPVVKEETRQLVLQKAKELDYAPNMLARGLRSKSSKTIAAIFNDIENPVLTYIYRKISIDMAKYGYTTLICDAQFDPDIERSNILSVVARMPDFVIIEPTTSDPANLKLLANMANRVIVLGKRYPGINHNFIQIDYELGGYLAAKELLAKGHRDCLVIAEPIAFPISGQFIHGIHRAYQDHGLELEPERIIYTHASIENGSKAIMQLWDYNEKRFKINFTGVMTFNDAVAYGVYKAASHLALRIPQDISVIGFDDNPLSAFSLPPLTTIYLPREKIAGSIIEILHNVLLHNDQEIYNFFLEPYLVSRDSVNDLNN